MFTAQKLAELITYTIEAQDKLAIEDKKRVRWWDNETPQGIHPVWCAMTFLTETNLPTKLREQGWQALLLHDILEDTTAELPKDCSEDVRKWVDELTAADDVEVWKKIWTGSDEAKLLKLYDTTSNLLDSTWMTGSYRLYRIENIKKLVEFVKKTYGNLNIVIIAKAICKKWDNYEKTKRD